MSTSSSPDGSAGGEPRWLDDAEQQAWRNLVSLLHLLPLALDRQLQADAGLPHAYYLILAMLSEAPDRSLRMSQLAQVTSGSQSRLSHSVSRLEERGWVERRRYPGDRRGQLAVLTDAGYAVLVEAAPGHVAEVRRRVFDALTPEQVAQLSEITGVLATGMSDELGLPRPGGPDPAC